jgi:hypothetical protein
VARRNLGDVLHYFISEEEQASARSAAEGRARESHARDGGILIPASPDRPVSCALALELAGAIAPQRAEVLASFARSPLTPPVPGVRWVEVEDLAAALGDARGAPPALVVERPARLGALLERVAVRLLDSLVLPVTAAPLGLARALGFLRGLQPALAGRRVLVLTLGAQSEAAGAELASRLASAAQRQLGLRVERLGELAFDAAGYRSLLHGESLQVGAAQSASSHALRELGARLAGRAAA